MPKKKDSPSQAPLRRLTQAELDSFLDKAADILRGNIDHSEFRGYVFALLFFKRISDVYEEEVRKLVVQLGDEDLAKDPRMHNFVVPEGFLWEDVAGKSRDSLGTALNDAMTAIERANQPKFDGILTSKIDFNKHDELPREKLINLINHFREQVFDRAHVSDDVFGNAYEYLIRNFASKAGKSSGEFYTPREVAVLMAEMIEPEPGQSVCDWASGSGGLLLQCRNFVKKRHSESAADQLMLAAQESNVATYNISRINMILHGVKSWNHQQGDSIRSPKLVNEQNELLTFDRIVMNPPFSLEDWGYDDLKGGDPRHRFDFGMPPRDNADYAWLQQVLATLKPNGKAIVVMSQGVLFRGQPELTESEDGRNQKADTEYLIRKAFVESDIIEAVVVLPSKLFYGNNVPACLIVLNRQKPEDRKGRMLVVWASRNYMKSNPQNVLRASDLMRVLVPWRAFGDLESAKTLVAQQESSLIAEEQGERDRRMRDIADAFAPVLAPLGDAKAELSRLEVEDYDAWTSTRNSDHPFFGRLCNITEKRELRSESARAKIAYKEHLKTLRRLIKDLEKIDADRTVKEAEVRDLFDSEIRSIREAASDLREILSDANTARQYFRIIETAELGRNEYNLNVARYVQTWAPEDLLSVDEAIRAFVAEEAEMHGLTSSLAKALNAIGEGGAEC